MGRVEGEQASAARQVERNQSQRHIRIGLESGFGALRGIDQIGRARRVAVAVQADRIESRVGDAEGEILQQPGLLHIDAELQIVRAGRERKIALDAQFRS